MRQFKDLPGSSSLSGLVIAQGATAATSRKVNLTAVLDPGVGNDSSQGYGVGSLWVNTLLNKVFWCASPSVGVAVWKEAGGGSSGTSVRQTVTVVNTFITGNIIRKTAAGWSKAQADSASNAEAIGIVESASAADFTVVYFGACTITAHGYTIGDVLFVSAATAGLLTATEPATAGNVSKPVAIVLDANTVIVIGMRGTVVATASRDGCESTALGAVNIAWTIANKKFQILTGNTSGPVVVNLSRSGAAAGDIIEVLFSSNGVTGTNTLTIQENGAGSLWSISVTCTITGSQKYVYTNGGAWVLWRDNSLIS